MLKTTNLLKFFLILSPILIYAEEEKKNSSEILTKSQTPKDIAPEIVKKERIDFLNKKISLAKKN